MQFLFPGVLFFLTTIFCYNLKQIHSILIDDKNDFYQVQNFTLRFALL